VEPLLLVVLITAFALLFDIANGWNDAANAIATVVSTRVLSPVVGVLFGAVLNFIGALYSSEVAKTVGRDIVDPAILTSVSGSLIFMSAVAAAPVWITWCTWRGLPISCSHSLMGALCGAAFAAGGAGGLRAAGIRKIVSGVFLSPILGFAFAVVLVLVVARLCHRGPLHPLRWVFGKLQIVSSGLMAFSHGTGDAQKAMGIITGALVATGYQSGFHIPVWVRLACAGSMAFGTAVGGWRVIRTLGNRLTHLQTYQGFAAETAASATILLSTLRGYPISTTHSITGAILGVGAAHGAKTVRWGIGKKIVFAWVFTFPACLLGGALCFLLLQALFSGSAA